MTFEELKSNKYVQGVAAVIVVIAVIALAIAGGGLLAGLLLIVLIGISIYFGSIRILSGSALLAVLLKTTGASIQVFADIWLAGPKLDYFFAVVSATGYMKLTLVLFFVFYLISFTTGSIRLFSFENKTTVKNKTGEKEEDPEKPRRTIDPGFSGRRN